MAHIRLIIKYYLNRSSRRNNSIYTRVHEPTSATRNTQSFEDQLRKNSDEKEGNSLAILFSLLVIASYLNRLRFKEIINEKLRWDPSNVNTVLAQLTVLSVLFLSEIKVALSRIHETFTGIDQMYLVGESIDLESLNDDLYQVLDRMPEYGCSPLHHSIYSGLRTPYDASPYFDQTC